MNASPAPTGRAQPPKPGGGRGPVVALIAIAILAGLLFWTVSAIQKHNAVQNCIDSGRHDCVALPND